MNPVLAVTAVPHVDMSAPVLARLASTVSMSVIK
jgi:hypothetical protein